MRSSGKLEKLGLRSSFDFVLHLPLRYEDETVLTAPQSAPQGRPVNVQAKVLKAQVVYRPKRHLIVHAEGLVLRFFNFYPSQLKQFQRAADQDAYSAEARIGLVRAYVEKGDWRLARKHYTILRQLHPKAAAPLAHHFAS